MRWQFFVTLGTIALVSASPQTGSLDTQIYSPMGIWITTTAYNVGRVQGSICPFIEFGAFFSGEYGHNQHYLGPGGDTATCSSNHGCISSWNWTNHSGMIGNILLVPKTWLYIVPCLWLRNEAWVPSYYSATIFIR